MPRVDEDYSNMPKQEFELLPKGEYEIFLYETKDKEGDNGPFAQFIFKVAEGQPNEGKSIMTNISYGESSMWRRKQLLEAFGIDTSKPVSFEWSQFEGEHLKATVKHSNNPKDNTKKNDIDKFLPKNPENTTPTTTTAGSATGKAETAPPATPKSPKLKI